MPSQRPGKGKAAMYIAGTNGNTSVPMSETVQRLGGNSAWHKGAMSKRFDTKEESMSPRASAPVRTRSKTNALAARRVLHSPQSSTSVTIPKNSVTKDDEAAAMAAMFQAQTANWEETQEKMSQLVSRLRGSSALCSRMMSHNMSCACPPIETVLFEYIIILAGRLSPAGAVASPLLRISPMLPIVLYHHRTCVTVVVRKVSCHAFVLSIFLHDLPGHWIQDCPTNSDREFDNKPRIKRTTGIPRSFLKAVENPNKGELAQGVMVTPEGGYVVAQPDS